MHSLLVQNSCTINDNDGTLWIEKAFNEIHETHEIKKQKLRSLRELVQEKYGSTFNDEILIRFLRSKKFDTLLAMEMVCFYVYD